MTPSRTRPRSWWPRESGSQGGESGQERTTEIKRRRGLGVSDGGACALDHFVQRRARKRGGIKNRDGAAESFKSCHSASRRSPSAGLIRSCIGKRARARRCCVLTGGRAMAATDALASGALLRKREGEPQSKSLFTTGLLEKFAHFRCLFQRCRGDLLSPCAVAGGPQGQEAQAGTVEKEVNYFNDGTPTAVGLVDEYVSARGQDLCP